MKNNSRKETIKTWVIILLIGAIVTAGAYTVGENRGYEKRVQFNAEVTAQVESLKPQQ